MNFVFSIVIPIYNSKSYLKDAINSIINQTFDFKDVQLILVDDGSSDNSKEIAIEYQSKYPDNILVLSQEHNGQASALNLALEHIKGEYVNFLNSDDKLSENTLKEIYKFFSKNDDIDVVSIPMIFFEKSKANAPLNLKFTNRNRIVDLIKEPESIQLSLPSSFIRKDALKNYTFDDRLINAYDSFLLNKILLDNKKYGLIGLNKNVIYHYRKRSDSSSISDTCIDKKEFFTDKLKYFSKSLLEYSISKEGQIPEFIKNVVFYDLDILVRIPELPEDLDKEEFWKSFDDVLDLIDMESILDTPILKNLVKSFLVYLKNKEYNIEGISLLSKGYLINDLNKVGLKFDVIEFDNGILNLLGFFTTKFYKETLEVEAIKESNNSKEVFKPDYFSYPYSRRKDIVLLGYSWEFFRIFNFKIPIDKGENCRIYFKIIFDNGKELVDVNPYTFGFTQLAGLTAYSHYLVKDDTIIFYSLNSFVVIPYSYKKMLKLELRSCMKILFSKKRWFIQAILFRFMFIILFPSMKNRKIWLFNDRPDRADDNGKHLFTYATKQNDDIEKYYVINKDCEDFNEMKKISENIIPLCSIKHKILYLFADKVITPFINEDFFNPFHFKHKRFYNGLIVSKRYFLQHGILIGSYSNAFNSFRKHLSLFVTSADLERQSILEGGYNYSEDVVQTLGLPRYDNLKNKEFTKQILFMPTWRNYLKDEDAFVNSEYFSKLSSFINNDKLVKFAKENDYKIVFKPHPEVVKFADLFEIKNKDITYISVDESYQELFNSSSILVTDYSTVFFDFSYLKKPVIYYQYGDEYHYDKGYFDFETMGFGDIIEDEEVLINKIIEYINNGCIMEDKYKERVDTFFKYTDRNNCKRCYEWILNH